MSYYKLCKECGAHLDPGEICDCQREGPINPNTGKPWGWQSPESIRDWDAYKRIRFPWLYEPKPNEQQSCELPRIDPEREELRMAS